MNPKDFWQKRAFEYEKNMRKAQAELRQLSNKTSKAKTILNDIIEIVNDKDDVLDQHEYESLITSLKLSLIKMQRLIENNKKVLEGA